MVTTPDKVSPPIPFSPSPELTLLPLELMTWTEALKFESMSVLPLMELPFRLPNLEWIAGLDPSSTSKEDTSVSGNVQITGGDFLKSLRSQ